MMALQIGMRDRTWRNAIETSPIAEWIGEQQYGLLGHTRRDRNVRVAASAAFIPEIESQMSDKLLEATMLETAT